MPGRSSSGLASCCALLLLLAGRPVAAVPATPEAVAPAPNPKLPAGVTPLPAASAKHLAGLLRGAETYRGLKARRPVPAGSLGPRALKEKVVEAMAKDYPPERLRAFAASLKAFGLIPEAMDLRAYLPELLSSQVAGFYDPDRKYLALVDLPHSSEGEPSKGEKGSSEVDQDMTLVHELTHALQDQSFDLDRFENPDPLSDAGTAGEALVEGDATLTMLDYEARKHLETTPGMEGVLSGMMRDPKKTIAASPDLPGTQEMLAAPAWFRDTLLFSYLQGAAFCLEVRRQGGQKLLDYAFTTDPPRSTEQILHPEKWYGRRDDPVALHLPDLAAELPGYARAAEGELGELGIRIYLREGLESVDRAAAAADGWGGDRFAVYEPVHEKEGGRLILWVSVWDTDADAGEFRAALAGLPGWRVEPAGPRRVVAVHWSQGSVTPERWAAVRARLAAATAEPPANRAIDLKAIGASPRPEVPSPAGAPRLAGSPPG
jgi:hypothetical protein